MIVSPIRSPLRPPLRIPLERAGTRGFFGYGTQFNLSTITLAILLASGVSNSVATTNPPGTVVLSDGTVGYGAHNCSNSSVVDGSWSKAAATSITPNYGTGPTGESSTLVTTSTANGGWIERTATIRTTGAYVSIWARSVNGVAGTISLYTNGGTYTSSQQPVPASGVWTLLGFSAPSATSSSCGFYANTVGCQYEVSAWNVSCGDRRSGEVPTTTSAVYAPRLTCDRGATSNALVWPEDITQAAWSKSAGSASGTKFTPDTSTAGHFLQQTPSFAAGQTVSIYADLSPAGYNFATLFLYDSTFGNRTATFDLTTGAVSSPNGMTAWSAKNADGSWRCYAVAFSPASGIQLPRIYAHAVAGAWSSFTGDGTSGINVLRAQVNPGLPLPYLRTFGSALLSSGTPTSQNLLPNSSDLTAWTSAVNITRTATTLTFNAAANSQVYQTMAWLAAGCVYTLRVRVRAASGTQNFRLNYYNGSVDLTTADLTATTTAQSFLLTFVASGNASQNVAIVNQASGVAASAALVVDAAWLHEGTADLAYTPTTGTPVSVYPQLGLLSEEARTNLLLNSATVTTQGITVASGSTYTLSFYGPSSSVTVSGAATGTLSTDASGARATLTFTAATTTLTIASTTGTPILGQVELGGKASSYIPNGATATTRSSDLDRPLPGFITDGPQTLRVRFIPAQAVQAGNQAVVGRSSVGPLLLNNGNGVVAGYDSTNVVSSGLTPADGVPCTAVMRWGGSGMGISVNGSALVTQTFDGTMGGGTVTGWGDDGTGANHFSGVIQSIEIAPILASDAQMPQLSAGTLA